MKFHTDCRQYRTDRPCLPHKRSGFECEGCPEYDPVRSRILMVKLGAMGDVLRTTALLDPLRKVYPGCSIEWITLPESVPLLHGVVDRVLVPDMATLAEIQARVFDLVINLDLGRDSAALATVARAQERRGFLLDENGAVLPCDARGRDWFEMSLNDPTKRANTLTYQDRMLQILGLEPPPGEIQVHLTPDDRRQADHLAALHSLRDGRPVIGLNIGAGGRWRWKAWTPEGFLGLAASLNDSVNAHLLLLYGPNETDLRDRLLHECRVSLVDTRCDNPIRQFMGIVDLCDLVVTGDTLALHIALGLGKRVVALFGPTSLPEIETYGRGEKLAGEVPCLGCYLNDCDIRPMYMETLAVETVLESVERGLRAIRSGKLGTLV